MGKRLGHQEWIEKNQEGLYKSNTERTRNAREKALEAILALKSERRPVNFSTITKQSGVSRHFLYSDEEVKKAVEVQTVSCTV